MKIIYRCTLEISDEFEDSECEGALPLNEINEAIKELLMKGLTGKATINITSASVKEIK